MREFFSDPRNLVWLSLGISALALIFLQFKDTRIIGKLLLVLVGVATFLYGMAILMTMSNHIMTRDLESISIQHGYIGSACLCIGGVLFFIAKAINIKT